MKAMESGDKTAVDAASAGATATLAAYVAVLRYEELPSVVVEKTRSCVLDVLGCMIFGATLPWTRIVADVVREEGGAAQASLVGSRGACRSRRQFWSTPRL